jgi:hypothetical protein
MTNTTTTLGGLMKQAYGGATKRPTKANKGGNYGERLPKTLKETFGRMPEPREKKGGKKCP